MADTIAPVPNQLSFSGTTGTLTWTETDSPPVIAGTNVCVSNAGTSAINGVYTRCAAPNASYKGAPQYTNGFAFLYFISVNNTIWGIGNQVNYGASNYYIQNTASATATNIPQEGWILPGGNPLGASTPPPFVYSPSNIEGGLLFQTTSGTAGQLSGGAVTISNVITNGTTTTFTTSRVIAPTETGSFKGAAGAFSDSASPPNTTAAFSIPITSSQFSAGGTPTPNLTRAIFY